MFDCMCASQGISPLRSQRNAVDHAHSIDSKFEANTDEHSKPQVVEYFDAAGLPYRNCLERRNKSSGELEVSTLLLPSKYFAHF